MHFMLAPRAYFETEKLAFVRRCSKILCLIGVCLITRSVFNVKAKMFVKISSI